MQAIYFTFRRCRTTAGSLVMSLMFHCTSSEPRSTRQKVETEGGCPRLERARRSDSFVLKLSHEQGGSYTFGRSRNAILRTGTANQRHAHWHACQTGACRRKAGATIRQSSVGSGFDK